MARQRLYYLGPEGTFTHQAAIDAAARLAAAGLGDDFDYVACDDVRRILGAAEHGDGWGVIAWENNVEGYVVPNLDMMIDSTGVAGFARTSVDIAFDAFVTPATYDAVVDCNPDLEGVCLACSDDDVDTMVIDACTTVHAHPHGLAQCRRFARDHGLEPVPAASNAAACRDLATLDHMAVALGPAICGELYGLRRVELGVQDYASAKTDFLVVARRDDVAGLLGDIRRRPDAEFESIVTFIPLVTGPGVLADLLDVLRDAGLNMTSFISRPIKGHDGTYNFTATLDAAPWEPRFRAALGEILGHGDWAKTLAVYPRRERPHPPVSEWMLPNGGVRDTADATAAIELLW
ncbi:prephenate dehydratase [Bifidobacterium choloepi]|uniref:Prephenate dehydratase n=1 Tax=Bifidobacterium choloepi TaxID=2614131 RepID=A0A6I5NMZ0_9BIFI|nr:prephenate dehydratase domain-containing protein [Bifidobacterium choloepi]NEG70092.1 chorismate mutase [Bifidobacterium choloepi]